MQSNRIRGKFLEYFHKNGHVIVPSSSLVPHNDPTLMFTTAGMVQFKNYFTGVEKPPFSTAVSSQKCVRAGGKHNDLENVGYTARHNTFFEMLGNFSFGDYFKERAIVLAWELLTKEFGVDPAKLYITVYHTDDESYGIWQKLTGFGSDKIIRIPTADNFWAMGETGPCGPCSEIFYDHGEKYSGGLPGTADADGDRYIEVWNLVFMQYEDQAGGERVSLPRPSIDTGMGLERIAGVLQGKNNNFEIDIFQDLINSSKQFSGNHEDLPSHKVIADHIRSCSFLIADGVMPSNEGRGYVLRRIMRRAMRHVHTLGASGTMLHKIVPSLVDAMGDAYPELRRAQAVIASILELEENKFRQTLDKGMRILEDEVARLPSGGTLSGDVAFKLYDTFGFPLDLTCDILRGKNVGVDVAGFTAQMEEQKRRARASWVGSGEQALDGVWFKLANEVEATDFVGYSCTEMEAKVLALVQDGKIVPEVTSGSCVVVLNQTPFYAESGGQVGDTGRFDDANSGTSSIVMDTRKYAGVLFGHHVEVHSPLKVGQVVKATVDGERREKTKANHSATHLLHKALRNVLGQHVSQKGSLVSPQRLRFDFSHPKALTEEEKRVVELEVNAAIIRNGAVDTKLMSTDKAMESGAMALFGEKYGDEVRVVAMCDSIELCGGTHVSATGDIGMFKIVNEEAIASGVRRIEALTGIAALEYVNTRGKLLMEIAAQLRCAEGDVAKKIGMLVEERKLLEKTVSTLRIQSALAKDVEKYPLKTEGTLVVLYSEGLSQQESRTVLDAVQKRCSADSVVIVTSVADDGRASAVISVAHGLEGVYQANNIAQVMANMLKGSGGGRPQLAQVGGEDAKLLRTAINAVLDQL